MQNILIIIHLSKKVFIQHTLEAPCGWELIVLQSMHTKFGKDWQRNLEEDAENVKCLQLMCYHGQKQRDTCRSSD